MKNKLMTEFAKLDQETIRFLDFTTKLKSSLSHPDQESGDEVREHFNLINHLIYSIECLALKVYAHSLEVLKVEGKLGEVKLGMQSESEMPLLEKFGLELDDSLLLTNEVLAQSCIYLEKCIKNFETFQKSNSNSRI